jgi:hypothetical protein
VPFFLYGLHSWTHYSDQSCDSTGLCSGS